MINQLIFAMEKVLMIDKPEYTSRLTVPMRKEDNEALSKVRSALELKLGKRLSNAEAIRVLLKATLKAIPSEVAQ